MHVLLRLKASINLRRKIIISLYLRCHQLLFEIVCWSEVFELLSILLLLLLLDFILFIRDSDAKLHDLLYFLDMQGLLEVGLATSILILVRSLAHSIFILNILGLQMLLLQQLGETLHAIAIRAALTAPP